MPLRISYYLLVTVGPTKKLSITDYNSIIPGRALVLCTWYQLKTDYNPYSDTLF